MDPTLFQKIDPLLDDLADVLSETAKEDQVKKAVSRLGKELGDGLAVELSFIVRVVDEKRENALSLLTMGLFTHDGNEPIPTTGDSTIARYVVDGEIQVVPHDHCPKCWNEWDFKFLHPTCGHCGATLGKNVKVLLDNDVCPFCEKGTVTSTSPRCLHCDRAVNPEYVAWG